MKNQRAMTKQDHFKQTAIHQKKKDAGSLKGLFPVYLDDGKTIVFTRDGRKKNEVKERYEKQMSRIQ